LRCGDGSILRKEIGREQKLRISTVLGMKIVLNFESHFKCSIQKGSSDHSSWIVTTQKKPNKMNKCSIGLSFSTASIIKHDAVT